MIKRTILIILTILFTVFILSSKPTLDDLEKSIESLKKFKLEEAKRKIILIEKLKEMEKSGYQPKQNIDMIHYDFDLYVNPYEKYISGRVTLTFLPTAPINELTFRLHKKLNLKNVVFDEGNFSYKRSGDNIKIFFSSSLNTSKTYKVSIDYDGTPLITGSLGGGMFFATHNGVPSATTLSEPFEAYAWVPIIDEVSDKFLANINITVPQDMVAASNGRFIGVENLQNGLRKFKWQEDYPISAYLIAVNVTNYSNFTDTYTSLDGTKSMLLDYYVYPEHLESAKEYFKDVPEMISLYANYVGEYPFIDEKYGMVEFPWGGAMEHQTLTSMGEYFVGYDFYYNNLIYCHELSHQWFGDEVTCGTWHDIWLNEGFATYFEVLWMVYEYSHLGLTVGNVFHTYYDDGLVNGYLKGSVYVYNENKPFKDAGAIYDKGGWVLHMLSHVMGEDKFFEALRKYRQRYSYSTAITSDFQKVCEEVYGASLKWFFDQWVYTKKRPVYSFSYSIQNDKVIVRLTQHQKHKIVNRTEKNDVYIMPVDITLYYDDGTSETKVLWNDERDQTFEINVNKKVTNVAFDKNHYILKAMKS